MKNNGLTQLLFAIGTLFGVVSDIGHFADKTDMRFLRSFEKQE